MKYLKGLILVLALGLCGISNSFAVQGSGCLPTTGIVSGLTMAQDINAAIAALISSNSGASAPVTDCTGASIKGQIWLDTSVTPNVMRWFDGSGSWATIGAIDATNHLWSPPVGGGISTITSAGTTDLWSVNSSVIRINGTNIITAFAASDAVPGTMKLVIMDDAITLTHNSTSLILPGGINIPAAAGDKFIAVALSSNNIAVVGYTRADGSALTNPAIPLGSVFFGDYGTIPPKTVYGAGQALSRASYPAYTAAVTRAQAGTLTAGSATIASVGNTAGLGFGMPLEGTGIPAGTTIVSVTLTTIVMSANATVNGAQTVTTFLTGYGAGGSSTTVGVKDCRNKALVGRGDMNGTDAGLLTTGVFGSGASPNVINAVGGSQTITMTQANLVAHNHAVFLNDPGHSHTYLFRTGNPVGGGGAFGPADTALTTNTSTNATGITVRDAAGGGGTANQTASTGSTTPMRTVQPSIVAECVVQVLP
jgi:hypothetical protein